jgi:hypothetical protein
MRWLVDVGNRIAWDWILPQPRLNRVVWVLILSAACVPLTGCATGDIPALQTTWEELESGGTALAALQLTNPATNGEIEGYASAASVNRGEDIKLFVNTNEPGYTLDVFRIGWYNGRGMRRMTSAIRLAGIVQPAPYMDPSSGLIECNWSDPYVLHIPDTPYREDWPSGMYVARLTAGTSGKQSYIIFVVRDDGRPSDLLFQASVTTYQAYNDWGGRSLYSKPRALKVSFNRPYLHGHGTGHFLYWELSMVLFLEKEGYDVTYTTDVDTHERGNLLLEHRAFLSVGHDEYWSWQMRDTVEAARDHGVNLGFFGSNTAYWQIRFEPSAITGDADRTMVCYKHEGSDPISHSPDPALRRQTTVKFRSRPVNRPEDQLVGVLYETDPVQGDIVVSDASSWVFSGTGLKNGDRLPNLLGYEVDRTSDHTPAGTQRIAHSQYLFRGDNRYADMTVYTAPSGSVVFAVGSMQWNWGLVDPEIFGRRYENPAVKRATRNVLRKFGARPGTLLRASGRGSHRSKRKTM